jgi:hypothetical protein
VVLLPQGEFAAFLRARPTSDGPCWKLFDISPTPASRPGWSTGAVSWPPPSPRRSSGSRPTSRAEDVLGGCPPRCWATASTGARSHRVAARAGRRPPGRLGRRGDLSGGAGDAEPGGGRQAGAVRATAVADRQRRGRLARKTMAAFEADPSAGRR